MKKLIYYLMMGLTVMLMVGCKNTTFERSERTVTMIQESVTTVVNDLNEIQNIEGHLQEDFEATMGDDGDLSKFNDDHSPALENVAHRKEQLDKLNQSIERLSTLADELDLQKEKGMLPTDEFNGISDDIRSLVDDLHVYVSDYQADIPQEIETFKSIANPKTDYTSFFVVFDNINILSRTNHINLEKVLKHFEPLNVKLINLKVTLINMQND